jgi:Flp pilus assembly protein TadD
MRTRTALWLLAATFAAPVRADDGPPAKPAPPFEAAWKSIQNLVDDRKWADGEAAVRRLFAEHENDPKVVAHEPEIEEALKLCVFRRSAPTPAWNVVFGGSCSFTESTFEFDGSYERFDRPPWQADSKGVHQLDVRFDGPISIHVDSSAPDAWATLYLCWDPEKRGGYAVQPVVSKDKFLPSTWSPRILRLSADAMSGETQLAESGVLNSGPLAYDVRRDVSGQISVKSLDKMLVHANDPTYQSGYVGFNGDGLRRITIKGRVERACFAKLVAQQLAESFKAWQRTSWSREREIPAWARGAAVPAAIPVSAEAALPSDAPAAARARLAGLVAALAAGDAARAESCLAADDGVRDLPERTGLYVRALALLATGETDDAVGLLDRLLRLEPSFTPARARRGVALLRLRRVDEARADLVAAHAASPLDAAVCAARADVALLDDDVDTAYVTLTRASEAGVRGEYFSELLAWVQRAKNGPRWAQRFQAETEHFVVVSDTSKKSCTDAGSTLESARSEYAAFAGQPPAKTSKARVWLFSGRQGYLDWAGGLQVAADMTAGVYLPQLRQLAIWIPIDLKDFECTVRHEGFHQYLHQFVEDAPTWFDEGMAQTFEVRPQERGDEPRGKYVPLGELFAMSHEAFMANAQVMYPESRALCTMLRTTKDRKLKGVLAEFYAALRSGASADAATKKVMDPILPYLQTEFSRRP